MKTQAFKPSKSIFTVAMAIAGALAIALTGFADDDDVKVKVKDNKVKVKTDDGKAKVKENGKVKLKGDADEAAAIAAEVMDAEQEAEFKAAMVKGYVVPDTYYTYLQPVPDIYIEQLKPAPEGTLYRFYDGVLYTINTDSRVVVGVQTFED